MPPKEPCNLPCNQHITIFIWILGVMVTMLGILTTNVIANDKNRIEQDREMSKEITQAKDQRYEQFRALTEKMDAGFSEVRQRLSRIEAQVMK